MQTSSLRYILVLENSKNNNGTYLSVAEVKPMNKVSFKTHTIEITENEKILSGKQQLKFSDFGITPPRKMAGMGSYKR